MLQSVLNRKNRVNVVGKRLTCQKNVFQIAVIGLSVLTTLTTAHHATSFAFYHPIFHHTQHHGHDYYVRIVSVCLSAIFLSVLFFFFFLQANIYYFTSLNTRTLWFFYFKCPLKLERTPFIVNKRISAKVHCFGATAFFYNEILANIIIIYITYYIK